MHISWLFGEDSSPAPLVNTSKVERRTSEACGEVLNRKLDRKWDGQEGFTKRAVGRLCCTAHIHRKVPTTKKMEARLPLFVFPRKSFFCSSSERFHRAELGRPDTSSLVHPLECASSASSFRVFLRGGPRR